MATGIATIDFGATPSQRAVVTVPAVLVTSAAFIEAFLMSEASADHSDYEHQMAAMILRLTCGNIINLTSFDVIGTSLVAIRGRWSIRWVHNP